MKHSPLWAPCSLHERPPKPGKGRCKPSNTRHSLPPAARSLPLESCERRMMGSIGAFRRQSCQGMRGRLRGMKSFVHLDPLHGPGTSRSLEGMRYEGERTKRSLPVGRLQGGERGALCSIRQALNGEYDALRLLDEARAPSSYRHLGLILQWISKPFLPSGKALPSKRRSAVCARGEVEVGGLERLCGPVMPRP